MNGASKKKKIFASLLPWTLVEREAAWKTILERELPSREGDTTLARECQSLLDHVDESLASIPAEVYRQHRAENYEKPLALVTQWEETGTLLSPEEIRPILLAYLNLGMPEKMEALNRVPGSCVYKKEKEAGV